jgi:hypothetical protein
LRFLIFKIFFWRIINERYLVFNLLNQYHKNFFYELIKIQCRTSLFLYFKKKQKKKHLRYRHEKGSYHLAHKGRHQWGRRMGCPLHVQLCRFGFWKTDTVRLNTCGTTSPEAWVWKAKNNWKWAPQAIRFGGMPNSYLQLLISTNRQGRQFNVSSALSTKEMGR